ncbi:cell division protein FtsX [Rhodoplanes elegans]|uniref:cell division protein FtsX n=1 Tax=Rhodoplanes elegans TaxID=29408 RepID=UPI001FCFBAE5|nr:ABC transporter permease [Rhodoplanes elegans]
MSTTDYGHDHDHPHDPHDDGHAPAERRSRLAALAGLLRRKPRETPIVPRSSISATALTAVVAIMTFLASLTTGAVVLVKGAASDWQADVAREVTIQVRPMAGRDLEVDVVRAVDIARAAPGVTAVRAQDKAESARLLEPWLGSGLSLDSLPVPRLIVVETASGRPPDLAALKARLAAEVAGATLDDHRGFTRRLRAMADTVVAIGLAILALVTAATVLSVAFATRGAMATNRPTVEVLHFIGAKDAYVAGQFMRHFLFLGLQGGAIGGGAAVLLFLILGLIGGRLFGLGGADAAAMFGGLSLGIGGYLVLLVQVVLVGAVTAFTSRRVVAATLRQVR